MKNVLVISTSCHHDSNSRQLAHEFADGARAAGHEVEFVDLHGKHIEPCKGCYSCAANDHRCVFHDDAPEIVAKIARAEVVVWATPVYFYEMCGQMKTLIDRTVSIYDTPVHLRDVYLLLAAGEDQAWIPGRVEASLKGWIECFPGSRLAGTVFAGGIQDGGAIKGHPALAQAREMAGNV